MKLSTIRILGYTQIAVGLINLDYQRHKEPVLLISALAVAFGRSEEHTSELQSHVRTRMPSSA